MTPEELKEEASKQGYALTRKQDRWLPCKCGYTGRCKNIIEEKSYTRICPKCGFSVITSNEMGIDTILKRAWNDKVKKVD